jgi:hypothetical protein
MLRRLRPADAAAMSLTAQNGHLRKQRNEAWRSAEAAARYWKTRLDFHSSVESAQSHEIPEGRFHPAINRDDWMPMVEKWRAAFVNQLLTPAPYANSVVWKQHALANGSLEYTGLKPERLKHVISEDLAFLAAHPVRRDNSKAMARRREFKEAMRRRIRDIAASRDLSDEEIKPVLKLKHHEIANFTEKRGRKCRVVAGRQGADIQERADVMKRRPRRLRRQTISTITGPPRFMPGGLKHSGPGVPRSPGP